MAACRDVSRSPEQTLVARASGSEVYERDVRTLFERRAETLGGYSLSPESKAALWQSCIEDALMERAVQAAAREAHIVVLEDEVDGWLTRLRRALPADEAKPRLAPSELREAARAHLLLGKYVAYQVAARVQVSEDDLATFAEAHPDVLMRPAMVRLRFLRLPNADHVAQLKQKVARGKAPAEAASEMLGRHVEVGDLGLVALGRLPEDVRRRAEKLGLRKLSEPLPLGDEVAVFWVSDRAAATKDAVPAARRRIERRLRREREAIIEQQVLAELKSAAHAEVLHAAMPSDI